MFEFEAASPPARLGFRVARGRVASGGLFEDSGGFAAVSVVGGEGSGGSSVEVADGGVEYGSGGVEVLGPERVGIARESGSGEAEGVGGDAEFGGQVAGFEGFEAVVFGVGVSSVVGASGLGWSGVGPCVAEGEEFGELGPGRGGGVEGGGGSGGFGGGDLVGAGVEDGGEESPAFAEGERSRGVVEEGPEFGASEFDGGLSDEGLGGGDVGEDGGAGESGGFGDGLAETGAALGVEEYGVLVEAVEGAVGDLDDDARGRRGEGGGGRGGRRCASDAVPDAASGVGGRWFGFGIGVSEIARGVVHWSRVPGVAWPTSACFGGGGG